MPSLIHLLHSGSQHTGLVKQAHGASYTNTPGFDAQGNNVGLELEIEALRRWVVFCCAEF